MRSGGESGKSESDLQDVRIITDILCARLRVGHPTRLSATASDFKAIVVSWRTEDMVGLADQSRHQTRIGIPDEDKSLPPVLFR